MGPTEGHLQYSSCVFANAAPRLRIDCCFTGSAGLTVIDFKTDRLRPGEEQSHSEQYRPQIEAYSAALSRITGTPVRRRVLWYFSTGTAAEL